MEPYTLNLAMLKRAIITILTAGTAAGLVMALLTLWRLTPLILTAETFETHQHEADSYRTLFTTLTAIITGVGFTAILQAAALLLNINLTKTSGLVLGLCGFLSVSLAPAMGLPPALPGIPDAPVDARQIWWIGTITATAIALYLALLRKESWALPAALILAALPHIIGAPQPAETTSQVPATLAANFAANALATSLIFWCVMGYLLGAISARHKEPES